MWSFVSFYIWIGSRSSLHALNCEIMKDGKRTVFSISPPIHGSGIQKTHVSVTSILRITYPFRAWCQSQCPGKCAKCQRMADPVTLWATPSWESYMWATLLSQSNNLLLLLDSVARISWAMSKIQYSKLLGNITWCFASVWLVFCNIRMKTHASKIPLLSISVHSTLHRSPHVQRIAGYLWTPFTCC